jgi:hypothetical protein
MKPRHEGRLSPPANALKEIKGRGVKNPHIRALAETIPVKEFGKETR